MNYHLNHDDGATRWTQTEKWKQVNELPKVNQGEYCNQLTSSFRLLIILLS